MFIRELSGAIDFNVIAPQRNNDGVNRDYDVRNFEGRNGEAISMLEEFNPITGRIINAFWQVEYDPSKRTEMIYG